MQTETEFAELDFESPPSFTEAVLPDEVALRSLHEIEQMMQQSECALPESPVSDFPSPMMTVLYSPHRVSSLAARSAVSEIMTREASQLPRGAKAERAADTLRPVFVPRWLLKGEISGNWHANGVVTESWEVDCPQCFGSGRVGMGVNQRECEGCWGGGRQKQVRKDKYGEQGQGDVHLLESLDNNGTGVALDLSPLHEGIPYLLPDEERMRLRCLRPAGIYSSTALDMLKNRLAAQMEGQAREELKQYSRIENFLFEPESVRSQSAVAAWLYPAYLGWFPVHGAMGYVLCDALSGKANWGLGLASEPGATPAESSPRWMFIAAGLATAAAAGAATWYFLEHRGG